MRLYYFLTGFVLLSSALLPVVVGAAEPVSQSVISNVKTLSIQGVHLGMTIGDIQQELEKQGYVLASEHKSRRHYLMQYSKNEGSADGALHTISARFHASRKVVTVPYPHFIEYFYQYRPPMVHTPWEDTPKGKDAQRIIASLCGETGDQACLNSRESKTVMKIDFPQTKADFDGRLYEFEMFVTAGMYKVMVKVQ